MPKKKNALVQRFYAANLETRDDSEVEGRIAGRPIVLNSRTDLGPFDEIIDSGALTEANLNDVRLCLNHDTSYVYARSRKNSVKNTMWIDTDTEGLKFEADLAIKDSPKAKDFYSAVKRGDIDKMSFMFSIDEEKWEDLESDHPTRHITKIGSVVEISAVTFPAYDATEINARSNEEALENARKAVETVKQSVRSAEADDAVKQLELAKAKFNFKNRLGGN